MLSFTKYQKIYKEKLSAMMNTTWNFEESFDSKCSSRLTNIIFDWYLLNSNYKEICYIEKDNCIIPVGFLFAFNNSFFDKGLKKLQMFFFYIKVYFLWIFEYFGNKTIVKKLFFDFLQKEDLLKKKAFNKLEKSNIEILCFFVDDNFRGQGIGKSLLNNFEIFCKKEKIKLQWLVTDTDCNYKFYDKIGFLSQAEVDGKIGQIEKSEEGKSFLYSRNS